MRPWFRASFYIDGAGQDPESRKTLPVIEPATEETLDTRLLWIGSRTSTRRWQQRAAAVRGRSRITTASSAVEVIGKDIEVYSEG